MQIPDKLKRYGIRFVLVEKGTKKPFQMEWQQKTIEYDNPELIKHLENGGNYGVMGGGIHDMLLLDFDNERVQNEVIPFLPETFTVKSGSGLLHKYFYSDNTESFKIFDEEMNTIADIQGEGKQLIGAGSVHPNGNTYDIVDDKDIAFVSYAELKALLSKYDKKPKKEKKEITPAPNIDSQENDFLSVLKSKVKVENVLDYLKVDTQHNPTKCPMHDSKGGKCLGFSSDTCHCFHCEGSWNIFSLLKESKNISSKETIETLAKIGNLENELLESRKEYIRKLKDASRSKQKEVKMNYLSLISGKDKRWSDATELLVDYVLSNNMIYTTKNDESSEVWIYKEGIYVPDGRSEVKQILRDVLEEYYSNYIYNKVIEKIEPDTFISPDKFFKTNYPTLVPVQNGLLDLISIQLLPFDREKIFFSKLPVIYNPEAKCPLIEKFLKDVLSKEEDVSVFYELVGFSLLKEYRYEKAFMLVGSGRNGKSKSIELLKRLIGVENCTSIPLTSLIPESFSISQLFTKMLNLAGDIGNTDLKDTSMFKSLTGRDLVNGHRKFLNDVSFENHAKFVFACNELPMVYDMSRAFWDRWILLEYPYTFVTEEEYNKTPDKSFIKIKDDSIITKITSPEELSGLLNQGLLGLHRLFNIKKFSSTKGSEEVKSTWIRKSNSFIAFSFDMIEEGSDGIISKKELRKRYSDYCKQHKVISKSDTVIKNALQDMFGSQEDRVGENYDWCWTGIKWRYSVGV
jgi:putative DNA primase/helicase